MKTFRLTSVLVALVCLFPSLVFSADPKAAEKNPGDRAYDAFVKLIDEKDAKQDQSRINALSQAGIEFLLAYPTHRNANSVIDRMMRLKDQFKSKPALRGIFYTQVQSTLLTHLFDDSLSAEKRAALLALDTAMAEGLFRMNANKVTLTAWQEKLDAQLKQRSNRELLKNRVAALYEVLIKANPGAVDGFVRSVADSNDKPTAAWAKGELQLIETRKTPFALAFTAVDGAQVDIASFRGKVVCLFFWSAGMPKLTEAVDKLEENASLIGQKQFPVIAVCVDPESDREKVLAAIKKEKIRWPVHFDGQGVNSELCKNLSVTTTKDLPVILLIDQKGTLASTPAGKLTHDDKSVLDAGRQLLSAKK